MTNTLMAVHAHPDDEIFGTGGTLAKYAAAGDRVVVVYATRGEEGEMHDPDRKPEEALPLLGVIREQEARDACEMLGITDIHFLGYRDSGMVDTEANQNPANFMNSSLEEATSRLVEIMRRTRPQVVISYNEEGGYGHPDHIMTHKATIAAFNKARGEDWGARKLYYAARSREGFRRYAEGVKALGMKIPWLNDDFNFDEYGVPDSEITTRIDIRDYALLKKHALQVHQTQIPPDHFYLSIPDDIFPSLQGVEYFQRIYPVAEPAEHEDDLFDGLPHSEEFEQAATLTGR